MYCFKNFISEDNFHLWLWLHLSALTGESKKVNWDECQWEKTREQHNGIKWGKRIIFYQENFSKNCISQEQHVLRNWQKGARNREDGGKTGERESFHSFFFLRRKAVLRVESGAPTFLLLEALYPISALYLSWDLPLIIFGLVASSWS